MLKRLRIGIVGGGVAGCGAALMLARDGHAVELLEQTPRVGPAGAGILLQPSGQRVLAEVGLLETVERCSTPIEALLAWTHRGRPLSRLVYADYGQGLHALGVHRADLFGPLHAACLEAGVNVRLGQIVERTRVVRGGRQLLGTDHTLLGTYDLVLAADGSRSRLRAASGLPAFTYAYRPAALWAVGRADWPANQLVQYTRGATELCGLLPMGGGRCSFFWGIDQARAGDGPRRAMNGSFDGWRDRVIRLAPPAEPLLSSLRGWTDLMFASYRATVMPRVVADRVAFLGDAAHSAGPHLGQGANLALLDARDLRDALRAGPTLRESLEQYNARQRWRNAYYSAATAALMPSFQGALPGIGTARDVALPLLQRIGPVRRLMLRTLCGV